MLIDLLACWKGPLGLPPPVEKAGRARRGHTPVATRHDVGHHSGCHHHGRVDRHGRCCFNDMKTIDHCRL
jgi:hypothetical protein